MKTLSRLFHLLERRHRRALAVLFVLVLVGMVLETLGVGVVIPVLVLMTQSDSQTKYPFVQQLLGWVGDPNPTELVGLAMLALVTVSIVKTVFLAFLAWVQAGFVFGVAENLSQRLFVGYLHQPYSFHLQRNTAQLIRNIINQAGGVTTVIQHILTLLTEFSVLAGISLLLVATEPLGALVVMTTLGLAAWAFGRYTKSHLLRWGEAQQVHEGMRIQHLQQGLGGAKDVKLLGREDDFLALYGMHTVGSARIGRIQATLAALPRLWLELLAALGLAGLVFVMLKQGKPTEALLPVLGLFTAAAFRLMPSVSRVLGSVQAVRFSWPMVKMLLDEFDLFVQPVVKQSGVPVPLKNALQVDGVSFRYPSSETLVVWDINLSIMRGESVGFIGGSGGGKSTLVDIILGLLPPLSGRVTVDGVDIQTSLRGWQDNIGYVPQSIYLTDDTLRRNVAFGLPAGGIDEPSVRRAICAAQLENFVRELPAGLDTMVGERGIRLSGGQRQRIGIARALYHDPSVLVLDEATSSLDAITEREVMNSVRALQGEKTIIIVAHRTSTVEHCDRIYRLERGKLVQQGHPAKVLSLTQNG